MKVLLSNSTYQIILVAMIVFSTGCKKGCIDGQAANYDPKALDDDGSCVYTGNVAFWTDGVGSGKNIEVSIEGGGTGIINTYFLEEGPYCGTEGAFTWDGPAGEYVYQAQRTDRSEYWSGTFTMKVSECTKVLLSASIPNARNRESPTVDLTETSTDFIEFPVTYTHRNINAESGSFGRDFEIRVNNNCAHSYNIDIIGPSPQTNRILLSSQTSTYNYLEDGSYTFKIKKGSSTHDNSPACGASYTRIIGPITLDGADVFEITLGK